MLLAPEAALPHGTPRHRFAIGMKLVIVVLLALMPVVRMAEPNITGITDGSLDAPSCSLHLGHWRLSRGTRALFDGEACSRALFKGFFACGPKVQEHHLAEWRWQPMATPLSSDESRRRRQHSSHSSHGSRCRMPNLHEASYVAEALRGRRVLFVGDSLNKVMFQALSCLLWTYFEDFKYEGSVEKPVVPSGRGASSSSSSKHAFARVTVPSLELEVVNKMAPFVADEHSRLLGMPPWFDSMVEGFGPRDALVLNAGKWMGRLSYPRDRLKQRPGDSRPHVDATDELDALRQIIRTSSRHLQGFPGLVFWRTHTPSHYGRDGDWKGSTCSATTPFSGSPSSTPSLEAVDSFAARVYAAETEEVGANTTWALLDVTRMSFLRADGHPGDLIFNYNPESRASDCTHFCLTGTLDPWLGLLFHELETPSQGQ